MQASAWSNGKGVYGIRVGFPNRTEFFDEKWEDIEVEMDGDVHRFRISKGFWHRCPEIRDRGAPVIRDWLRRHHGLDWAKGKPPRFELLSLGGNRFRLIP